MNSIISKRSPLFYLSIFYLLSSFSDPYTIKKISDQNFRYEFYTTAKKVNPINTRTYYWFKGGSIHNSLAGTAGDLLHDKFFKFYHNNQLAEQGFFKYGLKVGIWKTWYSNGKIQTIQNWNKGFKSGNYYHYDENGIVTIKGFYKNDKPNRQWIDYSKKDTLEYKKGIIVLKEKTVSKAEKYKLKQETILANRNQKAIEDSEKLNAENTLAQYKLKAKEDKNRYDENKKIIKEKIHSEEKNINEKKKAAIEKERQERKAGGPSKTKIFFKKIWDIITPTKKSDAKSS